MSQINILPENLCNQIAAGEVVERPASVVKELVENSLDACAQEICIDVEGGGRRLIRIADDGAGMGKDDVFLCLERHATSKITSSADLFALRTLGFRGEALPSIAAVSRLMLRSRGQSDLEGWEITCEGGTVRKACATGMAVGTMVEVRDLFFNTPARRKFLRTDETEFGHIAELITRLALSSPDVHFRLHHNQRSIIDVPRHARLEERIAALLGRPLLRELVSVTTEQGERALRGYISRPGHDRATTGGIYTYINGRYIRDRVVQHAILDGVRNLIPKGRYPAAVLFLSIPTQEVDVNVHPTKHEVRFRDQKSVHDFIVTALRNAQSTSVTITEVQRPPATASPTLYMPECSEADRQPPPRLPLSSPPCSESSTPWFSPQTQAASALPQIPPQVCDPPPPTFSREGFYARLQLIGQFKKSYIVAEDEEGLIIIDQHAAHERIGFERLRHDFYQGTVARQELLFPLMLEFSFKEAAAVEESTAFLQRLGFELENFGGRTFALKSVPAILPKQADYDRLLHDLAAEISENGVSSLLEEVTDRLLMTIACHDVVRANQSLGITEIQALLRALDATDNNLTCPHGRPIYIRFSNTALIQLFRRSS